MMGEEAESMSVKWDHHHSVLIQAINEIYKKEIFVDVGLECEDQVVWVHKFILSACSEFFQEVLIDVPYRGSTTLPDNVQYKQLSSLLDFMYFGEVVVPQDDLPELLNAAEVLMIRGLAVPYEDLNNQEHNPKEDQTEQEIYRLLKKLPRNSLKTRKHKGDALLDPEYPVKKRTRKSNVQRRKKNKTIKEEPFENDEAADNLTNDGYSKQQKSISKDAAPDTNNQSSSADINAMLKVFINNSTDESKVEETPSVLECPQCKRIFQWRSNLTKHMRTHTGEKPYNCATCPYKTSYSEALKRHMRIHTGEKPYQCEECDYKSRDQASLKVHIRIHTGEKPYRCDRCDFKSRDNGSLKVHMKKHDQEDTLEQQKREHSQEDVRHLLSTDHGVPLTDHGITHADHGHPEADHGHRAVDLEIPHTDRGMPPTDNGIPHTVQGISRSDHGTPPTAHEIPLMGRGIPPIAHGTTSSVLGVPPTHGVTPTVRAAPPVAHGVLPHGLLNTSEGGFYHQHQMYKH